MISVALIKRGHTFNSNPNGSLVRGSDRVYNIFSCLNHQLMLLVKLVL